MTRTDELIAYLEEWRELIDAWPRGSVYFDWGSDWPGFTAKLSRSDRVGGKKKIDRMSASA